MNLEELRSLDPRDPGRWPLAVRAGVITICFVVLSLLGLYLLVWNGQRQELQQVPAEVTGKIFIELQALVVKGNAFRRPVIRSDNRGVPSAIAIS